MLRRFTTLPTADHLVVLITSGGSLEIEARHQGRWHKAHYQFQVLDGLAQVLRETGQKKAALQVFRHPDERPHHKAPVKAQTWSGV